MQSAIEWIGGDLSPQARIWTALGPALLIAAWFLVGAAVYVIRVLRHGQFYDAEVAGRGTSAILGHGARMYFAWIMRPPVQVFVRLRIPPNAVTTLGFLLSIAAAVAIAAGRFALGGWLYLAAGALDFVDGRLARETGQATPSGAALDSVLDRYSEAAVFIGLAWFYQGTWVLIPTLLALVGSMMVSYVRARGEGLGVTVKVGLMQRPERLVILGLALALAPVVEALVVPGDPHPLHRLTVVALVALGALTQLTAIRRFMHLARALDGPAPSRTGVLDRGAIGRTTVAAFVATAIDFGAVVFSVSVLGMSPWLATVLGCGIGGLTNFAILRAWAFAVPGAVRSQAGRYAVVSTTAALLNAGGVGVLLMLPHIGYQLAWLVVRAVVFVGWNHPLQRDYVFQPSRPVVVAPPEVHLAA